MKEGLQNIRKVKLKIGIMGSGIVMLFFIIAGVLTVNYGKVTEEQRRRSLEQITSLASKSITPVLDMLNDGAISREEAVARIRDRIRLLTYMDSVGDNYVFMSSYDGTMLVQPFQTEKEMTNNWDLTDDRGTYIIRELVKTAQSPEGGGFITYYYLRPHGTVYEKKTSYVKGIPEIEAYIGTGQYMTDIVYTQRRFIMGILILSVLSIGLLFLYIGSTMGIVIGQHEHIVRENRSLQDSREKNKNLMEDKLLMERNLRQAYKMEAVGTLAGGIAHDFNNILVPILGYAELLLGNTGKDDFRREYISEIFNSAERARDLVQQILSFSRQEKKSYVALDFGKVMREALKLLRATIPTTVELVLHLDDVRSTVLGDPTHVHQIVMNLVTNAYHAMETRKGRITVSLREVLPEGDDFRDRDANGASYLLFSLEDEGGGIDPAIVDKIFDPFFTTKSTGKGTGMGLAVVHGIVQNMLGFIVLHNSEGKGARFNVYFPVYEHDGIIHSGKERPQSPMGGSESILLIDDEEKILKMISLFLQNIGYRVTTCSNGLEGLEAYKHDPEAFNLIISDLSMPGMSGDHLVREIRKTDPDVLFVLLTGNEWNLGPDIDRSAFDLILMKPLSLRNLSRSLRILLDRNQSLPSPG